MVENPVKCLIQLFCRLIIVKTEVLFLKNEILNKTNAWNGSGRQYRHFHLYFANIQFVDESIWDTTKLVHLELNIVMGYGIP